MPIYEYLCLDCKRKSSFLTRSIHSQPELKCPKCGSVRLKKLVSRVAVLRSRPGGDEEGQEVSARDEESPESMGDGESPDFGGDDGGTDSDED